MNGSFLIAIIAAVIHFMLSILVSCALKNTNDEFLIKVKKLFTQYKDMLLLSSLLVGIIVYMSLQIAPTLINEFGIENILKLGKCAEPKLQAYTAPYSESILSPETVLSLHSPSKII